MKYLEGLEEPVPVFGWIVEGEEAAELFAEEDEAKKKQKPKKQKPLAAPMTADASTAFMTAFAVGTPPSLNVPWG